MPLHEDLLDKLRAANTPRPDDTTIHSLGGVVAEAVSNYDNTPEGQARIAASGSLEHLIFNPDTRASLIEALGTAHELFDHIGIVPPTTEQMIDAGIDLSTLGSLYESEAALGHEPRWVLAPSLPLGGQQGWMALFRSLQEDSSVNASGRIDNEGLYVNDSIADNFTHLSIPPYSVPTIEDTTADGEPYAWTLRLIPGTQRPIETNVSHDDPRYPDKPLVQEYLSLQALLLQAGEDPVDGGAWTWLNGTLQDTSSSPVGYWEPDPGLVYLYWNDADLRTNGLGVRPPVWE